MILIILIAFILCFVISFIGYKTLYKIDVNLTGPIFIKVSPNKKYLLKFYTTDSGATTPSGILAQLYLTNGTQYLKNIYYDSQGYHVYDIDSVVVTWSGDNKVSIDSHEINLPDGSYNTEYINIIKGK